MKKIYLIILLICVFLIGQVNGYTVEREDYSPKDSYNVGDHIKVNISLNFRKSSGYTFPADNALRFFTQLESPVWEYQIYINNRESYKGDPKFSKYLTIDGFLLSYPVNTADYKVIVSLEGIVPEAATNQDFITFKITEQDKSNNYVSGSEYYGRRALITIATTLPKPSTLRTLITTIPTSTPTYNDRGFENIVNDILIILVLIIIFLAVVFAVYTWIHRTVRIDEIIISEGETDRITRVIPRGFSLVSNSTEVPFHATCPYCMGNIRDSFENNDLGGIIKCNRCNTHYHQACLSELNDICTSAQCK